MTNQGSETAQASSLSAEIDEAIAWCSYSSGHKTARLLVRLRERLAEAPRVEIEERIGEPAECRVWRGDRLVFDGVAKSALLA